MPKFSFEECLKRIPSRFELVIIASKRASQILRGSLPRLKKDSRHNPARTALREICFGKVLKNGDDRVYRMSASQPEPRPEEPPGDA
ncbi:MAG: DNA-directed RNA polymerase subunit omega [Acidobacteria bacterium]|nr:DNA-directed RNA polymerase subunit omega [Acidobacteriota bacterium]